MPTSLKLEPRPFNHYTATYQLFEKRRWQGGWEGLGKGRPGIWCVGPGVPQASYEVSGQFPDFWGLHIPYLTNEDGIPI